MTKPKSAKDQTAVVPAKRDPTEREQRAFRAAAKKYKARSEPLIYDKQPEGGRTLRLKAEHSDAAGQLLHTLDTFGTASADFAEHGIGRLAAVMRSRGEELPGDTAFNMSLAAIGGIAPQNEMEAMLAVQMVGVHEVAMEMLTRAKLANDTGHLERYGTLATKLLRTFTAQTEALAKLRRGGSQEVVVKHVHVYPGGQAIVGNVTSGAPRGQGGEIENGHQAHALTGPAAFAFQADASMLCQDAGRDTLPIAGSEGKGPVPQARRRGRKRSAEG
ncbi:hypothetical protein [Methylobacterium sp. SI9]|uniref:hypothetical protein n=1 Tax=Methylobacterium guangdongense TaxID=3138811 RepID=UPI00313C66C3